MAGQLFLPDVETAGSMTSVRHLYSSEVQAAVQQLNVLDIDLQLCSKLTFHGTIYKMGLFVVMQYTEYQCDVTFGKIIMLMVHTGNNSVFLVKLYAGVWQPETSTYAIAEMSSSPVQCLPSFCLPDYYPLIPYVRNSDTYVVLRHTPVTYTCQ
jgi:hypothetical protein